MSKLPSSGGDDKIACSDINEKFPNGQQKQTIESLSNSDDKTNYYLFPDASVLGSGQKTRRSKLSINDESSHPINSSNTNNKNKRKRNIKMLNDGDKKMGNDEGDAKKKIKVDENINESDKTRGKMFEIYQPWAISQYGDLSKSKTITLKKQARIVRALKGLEANQPDSSKFRFWVKSKGFCLALSSENQDGQRNQIEDGCLLFIPSKSNPSKIFFKRIAVVEYFFNIIYTVHCSGLGGEGRHVGQKKTYRKITECYAFLPREAVTKFLNQCSECCKNFKPKITERKTSEETLIDVALNPNVDKLLHEKPGENYLVLMDALYKNLSLLRRFNDNQECEFLKENLASYQLNAYKNFNQPLKEVNVNLKDDDEEKEEATFQDDTLKPLKDRSESVNSQAPSNNKVIRNIVSRPDSPEELVTSSDSCSENTIEPTSSLSSTPIDDNSSSIINDDPIKDKIDDNSFSQNGKEAFNEDDENTISTTRHKNSSDGSNGFGARGFHTTVNRSLGGKSKTTIKPITSTYLLMTRSMGLEDEDALNLDSITTQSGSNEAANLDDTYTNFLKDTDKLKLMMLAWNYQNSAAARNGTSNNDLATMTNLWEHYQNLLGINTSNATDEAGNRSPSQSPEEANSPSHNKEDDEGSEDDSDDRIDQSSYDPERLKAFNMFVRMFVDENLDRMVPISKQPKEKVQAIIDSCARQFPDFSERARKRLRTYLKSCRRNKKTKDGWEHQPSRPTPAHLTSVQAEKILSSACENESLNAKRMRIGLEPISQSLIIPTSHSSEAQSTQSLYTTAKSTMETIPLSNMSNASNCKMSPIISTTTDSNANSINSTRPFALPTLPFDLMSGSLMSRGENVNSSQYFNHLELGAGNAPAPTDLSVKRPLLPHNLNVTEAVAVKQLITGYREAAAFLLRSADELEQLLLNQQK